MLELVYYFQTNTYLSICLNARRLKKVATGLP
jgi:hypothetical protein